MDFGGLQEMLLTLSDRYGVDPVVFGSIYLGSSPLFYAALAWLAYNFRQGRPLLVPFLAVGDCVPGNPSPMPRIMLGWDANRHSTGRCSPWA